MLVFGGVDGRILTKSWSILDLSLDHPCFFQTSEREFLRVVLSHLEGERQTPTKKTSCNNPSACFIRPNPGLTSLKENTPSKQGRNSNQNTGQVGFSYIPHLKEEGQSVKHPICGSLALLLMFLSKSGVIYHWCKKTGRLLMGWTTNLKWWSPNFLEPATVSSVEISFFAQETQTKSALKLRIPENSWKSLEITSLKISHWVMIFNYVSFLNIYLGAGGLYCQVMPRL